MARSTTQTLRKRGADFAPLDADEQAAIERAAAAGGVPVVTAHAVVSSWIVERARRAAGVRLTTNLAFDLGDSRLRGYVEAALPSIADAVSPFILCAAIDDLDKAAIVDLFVAAVQGTQAAAMAHGESCLFEFDDPLPFGDTRDVS